MCWGNFFCVASLSVDVKNLTAWLEHMLDEESRTQLHDGLHSGPMDVDIDLLRRATEKVNQAQREQYRKRDKLGGVFKLLCGCYVSQINCFEKRSNYSPREDAYMEFSMIMNELGINGTSDLMKRFRGG